MTPLLRPSCAALAFLAALGAAAQSPVERSRPARMIGIDSTCKPAYPPAALRALARGTTVLEFTVDPEGLVNKTAVLRSAGPTPEHRSLDEAAASSLSHCPFKPATDGEGRPVPGTVQVTYDWVIQPPATAGTPGAHPATFAKDDPTCRAEYPPEARAARAQGVSVLWFRVDARGRIVESHVAHPSGPLPENAMLDQAALAALVRCPITPGFDEGGRPIETVVQVEHLWALQ